MAPEYCPFQNTTAAPELTHVKWKSSTCISNRVIGIAAKNKDIDSRECGSELATASRYAYYSAVEQEGNEILYDRLFRFLGASGFLPRSLFSPVLPRDLKPFTGWKHAVIKKRERERVGRKEKGKRKVFLERLYAGFDNTEANNYWNILRRE